MPTFVLLVPLSAFPVRCLFPMLFPVSRLQICTLGFTVPLIFTSVLVCDLHLV